MVLAAIAFLIVPAALLVIGVAIIVPAIQAIRRRSGSSWPARLRITAGVGIVAAAALALGPLYLDVQYGVVILPLVAMVLAMVWGLVWLSAAAIAGRR